MSVAENIARVRAGLPAGVELVAVSKTHPAEVVMEAYEAGQRVFGENRPQEMAAKRTLLPADVRWHMIGHLQTNKVRLIAPFVEMIHSVDSARLAAEISRRAVEAGRTIDALLEIRIACEESKHGWKFPELVAWLEMGAWRELPGVRFRGVMGVATFTDDGAVVSAEFSRLAAMHSELRDRFFNGDTENAARNSEYTAATSGAKTAARFDAEAVAASTPDDAATDRQPLRGGFDILSMGMSDDYPLALAAGSTMIRIGSTIFGRRDYPVPTNK